MREEMTGRQTAFGLLAVLLTAVPASASSPDAWDELWRKSEAACLKAANLRQARVEAAIPFEGAVLRIVNGRYPQPHMRNAAATLYCLYDKKSGRAEISEMNAP